MVLGHADIQEAGCRTASPRHVNFPRAPAFGVFLDDEGKESDVLFDC